MTLYDQILAHLTLSDVDANSFGITSRQIFQTQFGSIEQEIWPLKSPQGISFILFFHFT